MPFFSHTAESAGLSISPLNFELTANPGDRLPNAIKIFNTSDGAQVVRITVEDFAPVGETGQVALTEDTNYTFSLAKWVTFTPIEFLLEAGQLQIVEFNVDVPEDAEPGGHYASILATVGGQSEGGSGIAQKIGALLLLQVAGEVKEEMKVVSMDAPDFSEYGPVIISTRFQNTGSVHLKPRGFISVRNMFGTEVAKLNLDQKNVLPDSIRKIDAEFNGDFLFGKYTATMTAIYGSKNEPLSYSTSFWIIPWKITAGVGIGTLFLVSLLFLARRRIGLAFKILFKGEHK